MNGTYFEFKQSKLGTEMGLYKSLICFIPIYAFQTCFPNTLEATVLGEVGRVKHKGIPRCVR
jgi:hypothetical protein